MGRNNTVFKLQNEITRRVSCFSYKSKKIFFKGTKLEFEINKTRALKGHISIEKNLQACLHSHLQNDNEIKFIFLKDRRHEKED